MRFTFINLKLFLILEKKVLKKCFVILNGNTNFLFDLHGNDGVDSSVADNNDDERHEKYLTVDQAVIDIVPSVRGHTQQDQLSSVGAIVRGHHHHL